MARNRRRARRQGDRSQVAKNAGPARPDRVPEGLEGDGAEAVPFMTADEELAEAQLAVGRPELSEVPDAAALEEFEEEQAGHRGTSGGRPATGAAIQRHEPSEALPVRFVGFIRGCWRELQRVQWPDRRQVMQATGVVLGFVIVAGAFLGLADLVSSKVVHLILK